MEKPLGLGKVDRSIDPLLADVIIDEQKAKKNLQEETGIINQDINSIILEG